MSVRPRPIPWTGPVMVLLLAGCIDDQPIAAVTVEVTSAELIEGDCTFGERGDASDPEWCHILRVDVRNDDARHTADVSRTSWEAEDVSGATHVQPAVHPDDALPPGARATLELRFATGPDVRLEQLRHVGTFGGSVEGSVPDYGT